MRILLLLMALAGCAAQGQLVEPIYQSGPYPYGPVTHRLPPDQR